MTVTLRPRTDADTDALHRLLSDLDSWEQRTLAAPTALSVSAVRALLTLGARPLVTDAAATRTTW